MEPMPLSRRNLLAAMSIGLGLMSPHARADDAVLVAAAADLKFAAEEIADAFAAETGQEVKLTFGSTGNFARQIREGAPFALFMAADETFILDLARDGFLRDAGALYAEGRIVIMAPHGSPLKPDAALDDLAAGLSDGRVTKFAIANPEHAPYGKRAEEALRHRGLWEQVQPTLVLGENVAQAAQFATSGNAQGGIIAYALALSPEVSKLGAYALIPADWHAPLLQRMALTKKATPAGEAFYAYMQSPKAREIMKKYGFALPGE